MHVSKRLTHRRPAANCGTARPKGRSDKISNVSNEDLRVGTVREKPIYAPLQPHWISLETEQFTMAQMADDHVPTQAESVFGSRPLEDFKGLGEASFWCK